MPKLSDQTRARRRQHILTSAWTCFSRGGFHATSMDDVIAATGMSSSAVYRYFRSKDELIAATVDEGLAKVRGIFLALLDRDPCPTPAETLSLVVAELDSRTRNPQYDMTRIALQTWAEAVRDPFLRKRARSLYRETLRHITELADRWRDNGHLPPEANTHAAAATLFSVMHGLIVMHHVVDDVGADALRDGLVLLGAAAAPHAVPTTPLPEAHP
ncbi:TetR/AcrR family transcriptional regulator [Mycobacterium avium]|uniref:TetR/AcrR family transcriptional regulator n=1 Tax=Mycobacterium avium TaxID=1764 RepID=UPI0012D36199|nr:TetR/AcrR family transcriptional regulator [Mycobacterium avium]MCG3242809.1 TetR/AcrR family transcriptional regulator [Mycobacterium avium subsp. hominissuis]